MRPQLLLCDEPTGNLDRESARIVADLMLELHRAEPSVLVLVTHSGELAARLPRAPAHERTAPRAGLMRARTRWSCGASSTTAARTRRSCSAWRVAVAVLAGALLVGHSVRESLRALALGAHRPDRRRAVRGSRPFDASLAERLAAPGAPRPRRCCRCAAS